MNKQKHQCTTCNTQFPTKATLKRHGSICTFIHTSAKEHAIDNEYSKIPLPSQEAMFQYLLHLTNKCTELEEKVAKLEQNSSISLRKNFKEYVKTMEKPSVTYSQWVQSTQITEKDLQILLENDLDECIKHAIERQLTSHTSSPIRAFTQKQHTFYIYDTEWRMMTSEELTKMISLLSHKVLQTYTKWAKEHRDEWASSQQLQERAMVYLSKANGMNRTLESRTSIIKKWLFTKIQVSLKNVDE
jgi:uncharacterized Zn-finger protein